VSTLALPERVRLRYRKVGRVRFTSQRDLARIMERVLRRASLPLARSSGFSPHALLSFGLGLPTGCASLAEYVDVRFDASRADGDVRIVPVDQVERGSLHELCAMLSDLLPGGVDVVAAGALLGPETSLQEAVGSCDWELEVLGVSPAQMAARVGRLLDADTVNVARTRKGRTGTDNIRPALRALSVATAPPRQVAGLGEVVALSATTSMRPRGVRPAELCSALGDDVTLVGACRTHQWIEDDNRTERTEPLSESGDVGGGPPVRTEVRGG
jgi:radical SAM-linked protein